MLPTPDTSHVPYSRVYEPAEDSFLMIDTLALPAETAFLRARFGGDTTTTTVSTTTPPPPLVVELGSGSGVVLAFATAQAPHLFGRPILSLAVDVNAFACAATSETVRRTVKETEETEETEDKKGQDKTLYLGAARADLASAVRPGQVDVLLFNPPYVPTPDLPQLPELADETSNTTTTTTTTTTFARDAHLLELAYAGGRDGMETTDRLLDALPHILAPRGCAYLLLCAQNRPEAVKARVRAWPEAGAGAGTGTGPWHAETVGTSGKQAGWEKLQIVRIWR